MGPGRAYDEGSPARKRFHPGMTALRGNFLLACVLICAPAIAGVPPLPGVPVPPAPSHESDDDAFAKWFWRNGEPVLDLRRRLAPKPGERGWRGCSRVSAASRDSIFAALGAALADEKRDAAVEAPALVALATTKDARAAALLVKRVATRDLVVRRHAALALGILDDAQAAGRLIALAADSKAPDRARIDAVLGLGLANDPESRASLIAGLESKALLALDAPTRNAVLRAAGARPDAELLAPLATLVQRRDALHLDQRTEALVALAFARHAGVTELESLARLLEDDDTLVRRAAAIGFGVALDGAKESGREWAKRLVARAGAGRGAESDVVARSFALASLGRIGGADVSAWLARRFDPDPRPSGPSGPFVLPKKIHLDEALSGGPFVAFALGRAGDAGPNGAWRTRLAKEFADRDAQHFRAAAALGIGLLKGGDDAAAKRIVKELRATKNRDFAAWLALACGLSGATSAVKPLRELIEERSGSDASAVPCAAAALVMLGDASVEALLLARLSAKNASGAETSSVLLALSMVGDDACVPAIEAILKDEHRDALSRAAAAQALGELVDPDPLRRTSRYRVDHDDSLDPTELLEGGLATIL